MREILCKKKDLCSFKQEMNVNQKTQVSKAFLNGQSMFLFGL